MDVCCCREESANHLSGLGIEVDEAKVEATFKDGLLSLVMPHRKEASIACFHWFWE